MFDQDYSHLQFQQSDEDHEESGFMEQEQLNQFIDESYNYNPFEDSYPFNRQSTVTPIQQDQEARQCTSQATTVELIQEQEKQEKKYKNKIDRGQVETKNIAAFYVRSIIKAIKKTKDREINIQSVKAIKKIEDKKGNIPLVALREFLSKDEISKFSQSYFTSFEFVDDLLSSSKQKDIDAPLKYLNNVYQGCLNPNSLQTWK